MSEPARTLVIAGLVLVLVFVVLQVLHVLLMIAFPVGVALLIVGAIVYLVQRSRGPTV